MFGTFLSELALKLVLTFLQWSVETPGSSPLMDRPWGFPEDSKAFGAFGYIIAD